MGLTCQILKISSGKFSSAFNHLKLLNLIRSVVVLSNSHTELKVRLFLLSHNDQCAAAILIFQTMETCCPL